MKTYKQAFVRFINSYEIYVLPALFIIFFINYHYYRFYERGFNRIFMFVPPQTAQNQYAEIQQQHPYSALYLLAEKYKNTKTPVYFLFQKREDNNLDYTSTYYMNQNLRPGQKPQNAYLSDLGINVNYFFYPKLVPTIVHSDLFSRHFSKGTIIISDIDFLSFSPQLNKKITVVIESRDEFNKINLRQKQSFYVFRVNQNL